MSGQLFAEQRLILEKAAVDCEQSILLTRELDTPYSLIDSRVLVNQSSDRIEVVAQDQDWDGLVLGPLVEDHAAGFRAHITLWQRQNFNID